MCHRIKCQTLMRKIFYENWIIKHCIHFHYLIKQYDALLMNNGSYSMVYKLQVHLEKKALFVSIQLPISA